MEISEIRKLNLRRVINEAISNGFAKNDAEYCKKKDLEPSYVSQLINGHRNIGERSARNLERKMGLENHDLDKIFSLNQLDNNISLSKKILTKDDQIPVISWVAAGSFSNVDTVLKDTEVSEWLPHNDDGGKNGYGLIVTGYSMSPKFEPEDRIYVNPDFPVNDLKTGDLVIVSCLGDTEATFKQLVIEGSTKYLQPLNPNWKEKVIKLTPDCRLVGKVVGMYRKI
ncbi:LexA family protein [Acinetobacter sp. ESBL14]|uniref:LexA family protein n=1 Tax=Acinetobacter sp. ESBL14 TaxID=3077329 RepID=UPI002FC84874